MCKKESLIRGNVFNELLTLVAESLKTDRGVGLPVSVEVTRRKLKASGSEESAVNSWPPLKGCTYNLKCLKKDCGHIQEDAGAQGQSCRLCGQTDFAFVNIHKEPSATFGKSPEKAPENDKRPLSLER